MATSMALMGANHLLFDHYNLRGPVLIYRFAVALVVAPMIALPWAALAVWALEHVPGERFGAAMFCLVIATPGAYFVVDAANVGLDRSSPRVHSVRFVRSVTERKGSGYSQLSSWRDPSETVGLTRNLPWGTLKPGDPIEVVVHDGALGWEYVASFRPLPAAQ
jgi:hypothetical protein